MEKSSTEEINSYLRFRKNEGEELTSRLETGSSLFIGRGRKISKTFITGGFFNYIRTTQIILKIDLSQSRIQYLKC
jgi:hypothetical protein